MLSGYIQDDLIGVEQGGRNDTDDKGMQDEPQLAPFRVVNEV
jgi:hypothetical protein